MKIVINPKYEQSRTLILQLIEDFEIKGKTIHEGRNIVKSIQTDYGEWIIKRYKKPLFFQRFIYTFFRKSKAERAYIFAEKLLSLGIETPEGIAYAEEKKNGLFSNSYFISTLYDAPTVFYDLTEKKDYDHNLANNLVTFFVELHTKGILHGDPNLKNILYHKDKEGNIHFSVIDTNRSHFKTQLTPKECLNNLKRITHRGDLLEYIANEYANIRGWDAYKCVNIVMKALNQFEERMKIKNIIRGKK